MSKFKPAGAAEILRSSQKDEEYMQVLRYLISDILQNCIGIPYRVKWQNCINTFADILFYGLTTLSGFQTLGEEYVNMVQVDNSLKKMPPRWRRAMDILLQTLGGYFILRFQRMVENHISLFSAVAEKYGQGSREAVLVSHLPLLFRCITIVQRLHLIAFYFYGSYYTIAKRLSGIRYVLVRRWLSLHSYEKPFKILGWIATSQVCLGLIVAFYSARLSKTLLAETLTKRECVESSPVSPRNQCALCLERRTCTAATPCGHLFCWPCVTSWMQNKEECPLCREVFSPAKLIYLHNY